MIITTFQAWKVALILCILTVLGSVAAGIIEIANALGSTNDLGNLPKEISLSILTTAGGLCAALPIVVISTYLAKFLLRITKGVAITLCEDDTQDW